MGENLTCSHSVEVILRFLWERWGASLSLAEAVSVGLLFSLRLFTSHSPIFHCTGAQRDPRFCMGNAETALISTPLAHKLLRIAPSRP